MENRKLLIYLIYVLIGYTIIASGVLIASSNTYYKNKKDIIVNNNNILVKNSYLTSKSYDNNILADKQIFLIIDLNTSININEFYLKIEGNVYKNNNNLNHYFKDISFNPLVYLIDVKDINKEMYLVYSYTNNKLTKLTNILLKPININDIQETYTYNLNTEMDTIVFNKINIKSYTIKNKFNVKYQHNNATITSIIQSNDNTILFLNMETKDLDTNKLMECLSIKYEINNIIYTSIKNNKTPQSIKNNLYLETNKEIQNANKIWLEFIIRNKVYKYYLKSL